MNLNVEDYYSLEETVLLRLAEKGGKEKELSMHYKLEETPGPVPLKQAAWNKEPESPLFVAPWERPASYREGRSAALTQPTCAKRRLKQAGLPAH